jgi:TolA-binding protein
MKFNKIKLFGLAALLSANLSAKAANTDQTTPVNDSTHTKAVKIMDSMTIQQMEDFINEANLKLAKLRQKIRDPYTHKNERLAACDAYDKLEEERDDMVIMLDAKRTGKTLVLYDIPENLTIVEMQQYIKIANKEINKLLKQVDSPDLSPEARQTVYNEYKKWKRNRDEMQKRLEAAQRSSTISYNSGYGSR